MEFLAKPRFVLSHKNTHFLGGTRFPNSFLLYFFLIWTICAVVFLLNHWNELSRHLCCLLQTGWCHDSLQIENFISQMSWLRWIITSLLWSGATIFIFFLIKVTVVLEPKQEPVLWRKLSISMTFFFPYLATGQVWGVKDRDSKECLINWKTRRFIKGYNT